MKTFDIVNDCLKPTIETIRKVERMNTPQHTPGPWQAVDAATAESLPHRWICGCGNNQAVITQQSGTIADRSESEANARMIAASPELLNALELTLATLQRVYKPSNPHFSSIQGTLDVANAAIAKATGLPEFPEEGVKA